MLNSFEYFDILTKDSSNRVVCWSNPDSYLHMTVDRVLTRLGYKVDSCNKDLNNRVERQLIRLGIYMKFMYMKSSYQII